MPTWAHQYWTWAGSNIGALPAEAVITAVFGVCAGVIFRPLLRRMWAWVKREIGGEAHEVSAAAHQEAAMARRIAADTYRHLTGQDHEHAPRE